MTTVRAALYLRYSSALQDEASIETQRSECVGKAQQLGATVVCEYIDEAQSGRAEDRPQFQAMIGAARAKLRPFDIIIVRKFSRFSRDVLASRTYKALLRKHGVRVVSVHEEAGDDPSGQLMEGIIEVIDQFYSQSLAQETRSGMVTNTKRGFRSGGMAPFGYRNVKVVDEMTGKTRTRLEVEETEAATVRHLFNAYANGAGLTTIATDEQIESFSTTVRGIIRDADGPALWSVLKMLRARIVVFPDHVDVSVEPDSVGASPPPSGEAAAVSFAPPSRHRTKPHRAAVSRTYGLWFVRATV